MAHILVSKKAILSSKLASLCVNISEKTPKVEFIRLVTSMLHNLAVKTTKSKKKNCRSLLLLEYLLYSFKLGFS